MSRQRQMPRRRFLRGLGTAIALPMLDAMVPAFPVSSKAKSKSPARMAFVYVPNGIDMRLWTPGNLGAEFECPRLLQPLLPYRSDILVISGLTHNGGRALGDGPGDHARAAASFLTGIHPKKTAGADICAGISVDQVAAQNLVAATRFASLELGCEDGRQVGNCDSGYSCAYSNNISWRASATPMPPEINPRLVFERLFAGVDISESPASRAKRERYNKSILDFVLEDTRELKGDLGPTDRRKLDEYLHAVREIERRIESVERDTKEVAPSIDKPTGIPIDFTEHARLMFDLMAVAFQADLTRITTFMLGREGSTRTYREIGVSEAHHPLTHHRNDPEMLEKVGKINRFHVEQFAYFLGKLRSIQDGEGTLMDRIMLVYGSGISDGNRHLHHDLPVLLVGRGAGAITGRHVRYPQETPMANLFLTMLDRLGVHPESLGDSNGRLQDLSGL
jgi:hypothetical protein